MADENYKRDQFI